MNRLMIQTNPKILDTIVAKFLKSDELKNMNDSFAYFKTENIEITKRAKKMILYNDKEEPYLADDLSKANYKVTHNFHYELVNQTKNYLCGKPVRISWKDKANPSKELKQIINDILYKHNDWGKFNQENVKNAQKFSSAWFRVSIDVFSGELKFTEVDSRDIIPFHDQYGRLECVIRMYKDVEYDENGEESVVQYAEVYDDSYKDVYVFESGTHKINSSNEPLLTTFVKYNDGFQINYIQSWNMVPFVEWKFNDDKITALNPIKTFVDILDIDLSDLANNVDDIQDAIWILENYQGQSLEQFIKDLKVRKAVNVGEDGSVSKETIDIPYEARMKLYEAAEKNIYRFGRGIDFANRQQLGNSTGVALKWSYGPLDEKADELEQNGQKALNQLFNLIFRFLELKGTNTEGFDSNSIEFIFDRTMITNEAETVNSIVASSTILSLKTMLENHPMVDDADDELERINNPEYGMINLDTGGNNDDSTGDSGSTEQGSNSTE